MLSTLTLIQNALTAGMTAGHSVSDDFYVKTWYTGDPHALPNIETPAGAVIPSTPSSRDWVGYQGLDDIKETIKIRFYQPAYRKAMEAAEITAGMTRLVSMCDQAEIILRTDPTFAAVLVYSRIINIDYELSGIAEANVYRIAEMIIEVQRQAIWGQ